MNSTYFRYLDEVMNTGNLVIVAGRATCEVVLPPPFKWDMNTGMAPSEDLRPESAEIWKHNVYRVVDRALDSSAYVGYASHIYAGIKQVIRLLSSVPTSRNAIIYVGSDDRRTCLNSIQFLVRKGRLDAIASFRSHDIYNWLPMDVMLVTETAKRIVSRLSDHKLDVALGTAYMIAGSAHIYEADVSNIIKLTGNQYGPNNPVKRFAEDYDKIITLSMEWLSSVYGVAETPWITEVTDHFIYLEFVSYYEAGEYGSSDINETKSISIPVKYYVDDLDVRQKIIEEELRQRS